MRTDSGYFQWVRLLVEALPTVAAEGCLLRLRPLRHAQIDDEK